MVLKKKYVQKYAHHTHHLLVIGGVTFGLVLVCKVILLGMSVLFGLFGRSAAGYIGGAGVPVEETCNGIDDDLDGEIDEGVAVPVYTRDPKTYQTIIVYECIVTSLPGASTPSPSSLGGTSTFLTQSTSPSAGGSLDTTAGGMEGSTTAGSTVDGNSAQGELSCKSMEGVGTSCMEGVGECRRYGSMECGSDGRSLVCSVVAGRPTYEVCDGLDNDCDGSVDEGLDVVLYADFDNDGYGDASSAVHGCDTYLEGFVRNADDCDDTDSTKTTNCGGTLGSTSPTTPTDSSGSTVTPPRDATEGTNTTTPTTTTPIEGKKEICNGVDDNANRQIDEGFMELGTACMVGEGACKRTGTVVCSSDGIETMCSVSPGLAEFERCDGVDNDCDGEIDEDLEIILYADFDNDGYGDSLSPVHGCAVEVEGFVANNYDCDDTDAKKTLDCSVIPDDTTDTTGTTDTTPSDTPTTGNTNTGNTNTDDVPVPDDVTPPTTGGQTGDTTVPTPEICNDRDDDADRLVDEDFPRKGATCTVGEGICLRTGTMVCAEDGSSVQCDVTAGSPEIEICDDLDNDCDGDVDEGMDVALYVDVDRDGYGSRSSILFGCASYVPGYVGNDTDCDDRDATRNLNCEDVAESTGVAQSGGADITPPLDDVVIIGDEPTPPHEDSDVTVVTPGGREPQVIPYESEMTDDYAFDTQTVGDGKTLSWDTLSPYYDADVNAVFTLPSKSIQGASLPKNTSKNTQIIYGNGTINIWTIDQLQQQTLIKEQLAVLSGGKHDGGVSVGMVDVGVKPTSSIMARSVLGGSMCGNGMCELITINGYASLEPLCPQDCSLSCGSRSMPTDRCMQYIQKDALYLQLDEGKDLKKLRSLQDAGILSSITKPFGYVGDNTLRVEFSPKSTLQTQMIELLYKLFDTRVTIEPVPLFLIQQTSSVEESVVKKGVTGGAAKESYDVAKQRYLRAIRIPAEAAVCVPNTKETLVAVVDNAFDTRHPSLTHRIENTYDIADNDRDVLPPKLGPDREHGTIAAGLVAGEKSERSEMQGSDLGMAKLVLVKAAKNEAANGDEVSAGIEGIVKAAELGARIVVTSWGTPIDVGPLKRVIKAMSQKGVLVVAAAGNYNTSDPFYPAAYGEVLAVGAVDKFMARASFSNYGSWVDVMAPGVDIFVPVPGNRYKTVEGTSEAAPLVAGVLAAAAALDVRVGSIIVPRSKIAAAVAPEMEGQLGKGVIQFPANACVKTQSAKYTEEDIAQEEEIDGEERDGQTPSSVAQLSVSPLDILLRSQEGPSRYHAVAASSLWPVSGVIVGWAGGMLTVLAFVRGWFRYRSKEQVKAQELKEEKSKEQYSQKTSSQDVETSEAKGGR